jgi:hypothetical protein
MSKRENASRDSIGRECAASSRRLVFAENLCETAST